MRIAVVLQLRRRLMQLDPTKQSLSSSASLSSTRPPLKRSFASSSSVSRDATATAHRQDYPPPDKAPRLDNSTSPHHASGHKSHRSKYVSPDFEMPPSSSSSSARGRGQSRFPRGGSRNRGGGASRPVKNNRLPELPGPLHTLEYVKETYGNPALVPKKELDAPKSYLMNFERTYKGSAPSFDTQQYATRTGKDVWRATVTMEAAGENVVAFGDSPSRKDAEKIACTNLLLQLHAKALIVPIPKVAATAKTVTLSDGSKCNYEQARSFMDYYCRRYNFGRPDLTYAAVKDRWEVSMTVGGRRIGMGAAKSKKDAGIECYLDVTQYLESCDPDLWKTYIKAARTGGDLGLAPKVWLQMSDTLEDDIRDLCFEIKRSGLYRNRPAIGSGKTGEDPADVAHASSLPTAPRRHRVISKEALAQKSNALQERHKKYLEDPKLAKMRETRASLPVYSKSEPLMNHIRDNEVSICLAATGSGKTTQIPQMILDDYIARGEGAKCNVVCTQPRRIAAMSVADRVAKERGEIVGQGAVGYQVRFDSKLPEEHGSITFCTTGIFLKRMQTALSDGPTGGFRDLEDVTHVVVDEVHERDLDTDLLLVVLKRLLADRRKRGNPLKVVLMSATIDPTLFQKYFPDEQGKPAGVTEIPGRSFPVTKHFMDDYVGQLAREPSTRWVFAQDPVIKYVQNELGPSVAAQLVGRHMGAHHSSSETLQNDLELPHPLIGLTIAHVLQKTDSGHVLVFLPGWEEIMALQRTLVDTSRPLGVNFTDTSKYTIHLLHSSIPLAEQQVVFEPPPAGVRRIILATNIAETSITIPDVVYVVDTGKIKEQQYDPEKHMSALVSAWVGSSNLNQRAGRAGRHRSGEYYGILGRNRADTLHPYQTVEMKRVDLSNTIMHVKSLNFPGMAVEDVLAATIEPPDPLRVSIAMEDLQQVGALDHNKDLTSLGRVLLQLPVEPQMGRLVLYGSFFRCLDQALTLAAILTNRDPFLAPAAVKLEAMKVKHSWSPQEFRSDALASLRAYNEWYPMQSSGQYVQANRFLNDNFLSKPTMLMIAKIKTQLLQSLYNAGVIDVSAGGNVGSAQTRSRDLVVPPALNANGDSLPLLAALIAIATQPKFAIRTGDKFFRTARDKMTFMHPSSVNHTKKEISAGGPEMEKQIFAFSEKRQNISSGQTNAQMFLVTTTRLDPMTYVLFGAFKIEVVEKGLECDGWLPIGGNIDALDDIQRLKVLMESCMLRVFEGITMGRRHRFRSQLPILPREEEWEDEGDTRKDYSLSQTEVNDLDLMTRDVVRILNRYSEERLQSQSRANSRPATPFDSPAFQMLRLPSGRSTPHNAGSTYNSRPGTPSQLSRSYRPPGLRDGGGW
ncbi:hypothetical protein PLICRDRAFT_153980 [Plicaturopsis crispa FD-325 SS-3]|nr:hypothetical protein PLICRDRAFT_153980 [Plicaturopsis crispa FD-325 SS-3]